MVISGLTNRLLAFERLLQDHPEYLEHVLLMQIAVPSRSDIIEYQDLKERIDKLVGMINGKFSTSNWSPIRYIYGQINQVYISNVIIWSAYDTLNFLHNIFLK